MQGEPKIPHNQSYITKMSTGRHICIVAALRPEHVSISNIVRNFDRQGKQFADWTNQKRPLFTEVTSQGNDHRSVVWHASTEQLSPRFCAHRNLDNSEKKGNPSTICVTPSWKFFVSKTITSISAKTGNNASLETSSIFRLHCCCPQKGQLPKYNIFQHHGFFWRK